MKLVFYSSYQRLLYVQINFLLLRKAQLIYENKRKFLTDKISMIFNNSKLFVGQLTSDRKASQFMSIKSSTLEIESKKLICTLNISYIKINMLFIFLLFYIYFSQYLAS